MAWANSGSLGRGRPFSATQVPQDQAQRAMTPWNIRDYGTTPADLEARYEKLGEHPCYRLSEHRLALREGATKSSYWIWVEEQLHLEREELERDNPYTQWEAFDGQ